LSHEEEMGMKPTQDLIAEHNAVLVALQILEQVEAALGTREQAPEHLGQLLDFFRGFVDRCHHAKEEDVLFPELERRGVGREGGPIGVMLREHDLGRAHVRAMSEGLDRLRGGESGAVAAIREHGQDYCGMLRAHINKENNVLFPMADRLVPDDVASTLVERFEEIESVRVGEGKHEAYHEMLHAHKSLYGVE
jgi:hemerythrin-like domain-containing protein